MDQVEPEKRIADLERASAMSVNDRPAATRQFVASPGFFGMGPKWSAKRSYIYLYGFVALLTVPTVVVFVLGRGSPRTAEKAGEMVVRVLPVLLVLFIVGYIAYYFLHNRRKFVISVTSDGLTINKRRGDVYSFSDARLGRWAYGEATMGTVLHLQSGSQRFVLGGRDHRLGTGTHIDEPPVVGVDAWVPAAEFDELLSIVGRRGGLDVRPPAPGGPTRCLLFPNSLLVQQMGMFSFGKRQRLMRSASQASLAIDVDADGIRVIDLSSNALIASARLGQVTATPATYRYRAGWLSVGEFLTAALSTTPEMVVNVPGMQPLTLGCRDAAGVSMTKGRFSWRGPVQQRVNNPADYAVSGADWLILVENFGLAPYLETHG